MIRELKKEDKDAFVTMARDFYDSAAVLHNIPLENILNTYNAVVSGSPYVKAYIIEDHGETAGYGLVSLTYSNEAGGLVVWIEELYIIQRFRGLGLGSEFLDFIQGKYSTEAKRFRLEIAKSNLSVRRLYLKKGFTLLEYMQMVHDVL
jgi:GNAT superfamily N-acetyltransferase